MLFQMFVLFCFSSLSKYTEEGLIKKIFLPYVNILKGDSPFSSMQPISLPQFSHSLCITRDKTQVPLRPRSSKHILEHGGFKAYPLLLLKNKFPQYNLLLEEHIRWTIY